nr:hypothetical protein [Tanacetum cinerariifolium]
MSFKTLFIQKKHEEEQAANARYWKIPACCDDDDDYNFSITPNEPVDSLSMGDEHPNTILATESDKFIKSSVENLVPNPSESKGENGCDMPSCFTTFSNILFNADYEFDSSDDQSLYDEDVPKKIFSNPLFEEEIIPIKIDQHHDNAESNLIESLLNHDSSIISSSSKIDSLLDEFAGELTLLKSISPGIDKSDCDPEEDIHLIEIFLYDNSSPRPPKEFVFENSNAEIESFSPSPILVEDSDSLMEEIDLSFTLDYPMPPGIEEDDYDSERDILIREELLDNYSLSLLVIESYHFDIPSFSRPPAKPPDGWSIPLLHCEHSPVGYQPKNLSRTRLGSIENMLVKDKQEKDIRTKPDKNGKRGKARPSDTPVCYLCSCEQCGNILIYGTYLKYNSGTGNSFTYDPIPESFDEVQIIPNPPPQCHFNIYLCQICKSNSHYGYECSQRVPLVYEPEPLWGFPEADHCQPLQYTVNHPIFNADNDLLNSQTKRVEQVTSMCEMFGQFIQKKHEEEQAANARYWKIPACCDDDDDYNFAITPNEPVDSLSMGDEHLNTIPATESDKFIKSSVENLVPNPSESKGENGCDMPACFTTFSNILFNADYEFNSSDDQSLYDEDVPEKIFSNPLFEEEIIPMKIDQHHDNAESDLIESLLNHDSSIISSSNIDSLLDEFTGELTILKSIPSGIDKTDCDPEEDIRLIERFLYDNSSPHPPEEFVSKNSNAEIESFSPSHIPVEDSDSLMEEIDLSFTPDYPMPPGIEEDNYDSEGDILIREELLDNYSLSLPVTESYHFDILSFSRPPAKPPDGNTGILNVKMMGDIFDQKVPMHKLMITLVLNQEKSPDLLSHQGLKDFQLFAKFPMMIHGKNTPILDVPLFHFYPLDQFKYGGIGSSSAT